jgi:acyl-CoA synthetase (NDP forming)
LSNSKLFGQALPIVAKDDLADAFFISLPMSGKGYDVPQFARDAAEFMARTGKPAVVASPLESTRLLFEQAGVPTFAHDEDAMFALSQLAAVSRLRRDAGRIRGAMPSGRHAAAEHNGSSVFLSEHDSLRCIGDINIPTVPYRLCQNSDELNAALDGLPGPWAIKACSPDIPHKSEYGLVRLSISDRADALVAFEAISLRVREMNKSSEGVIVATMQPGRREIVIGGRWDEQFGAVVMIGDGGKYVESMPDVVTLVYPFDADYAAGRMDELRIAALFPGVRGEAPWPVRQIADVAVNLGAWIHDQAGRIKSVDINPLIIGPHAFAAADALVELGHA